MPAISSSLAALLFDIANVVLIVGATAVLIGTLGVVWMGTVKERYTDERIAANEAQTATANAQAAKANERAAELALEVEKERTARISIEERVQNQGNQVRQLMPRRLTEAQIAKLSSLLSVRPSSISITHDMSATDAKLMSNEMADLFRSAGWRVITPQVMGLGNPPATGLALRVANTETLNSLEWQVKKALEEAEVPFDLQPGRRTAPSGIALGGGFGGMPLEMFPEVEIVLTTRLR